MEERDPILLLTKQFSEELTVAERNELAIWLQQSPEHEHLANELKLVWDKSTAVVPDFNLDLAADFQRVQQRIRLAESPRARIVPLGRRLLQMAALLSLLVMAVWAYQTFHSATDLVTVSAQDTPARQVDLPDGTHVWLRQGSALDYPPRFVGQERRVILRGEAYFEVAHVAGQPFRVALQNGGAIEVLGTEFNVNQGTIGNTVLVRSGKVQFTTCDKGPVLLLNAGERAFCSTAGQADKTKALTFNELAWQTGGLEFIKTPLGTVISDLEAYYHVRINLRNSALQACLHTAPLTNQPLEQVLKTLSLTYQLKVTHPTADSYELVGGKCR